MMQQSTDSRPATNQSAKRSWIVGNVLIAVGLTWLVIDRVLGLRYPLQWGGPNIGRGALLLLAVLAVLAGLVTILGVGIGVARAGRASPAHSHGGGAAAPTGSRRGVWVAPVVVNVVLVVALVALLGASGREVAAGAVGVTVTASGSPVLVLEVCRGSVDTLVVVGPNRGKDPNEQLSRLTTQSAVTGSVSVDMVEPTARWTGSPLSSPPPARFTATAGGPQGGLRPVSVTAADLASLDPTTVLYSDSGQAGDVDTRRTPIAGFSGLACAGTRSGG